MHGGTDGVLISYKGHELTPDEGHALFYGLLAGLAAVTEKVTRTIATEPHYFLAGLALSFAAGNWLRSN